MSNLDSETFLMTAEGPSSGALAACFVEFGVLRDKEIPTNSNENH